MKKITSSIALAAALLTCTACSNNETSGTNSTQSSTGEQSTADNSGTNSTHSSTGEQSVADNSGTNSTQSSTGEQSTVDNGGNDSQNSSSDSVTVSSDSSSNSEQPTDLEPSEGFAFESNGDGTCTLVNIGTCIDTDIVIPEKSPMGDTVTLIGEYALMGLEAESVSLINYNYEVDERAFQYGEFKTLNIIGGNPVFGDSAFSSCEDIETITFQNCKIESGEYSFMSCGKDAALTFTDCTGYIDERAFQYGDFESISFTNCDLELDDSSFSSCENVKSLTISESTISAGQYSFMSLGKSADIEITHSDIKFDDRAFQYASLKALNISEGTLEMGDSVFASCEDLTDVNINCNISMGEYAFMSCEDLVNVSICDNGNSDNEIEIGNRAFQYCKRLAAVKIGNGNVNIGSYVFNECADDLTITVAGKDHTADSIKNGI